jgi:hypothetical protein
LVAKIDCQLTAASALPGELGGCLMPHADPDSPLLWRLVATFDDVIRLTAHLPEVTVSTSYGTPALKVRQKGFCRLWGDRDRSKTDVGEDEVLVVFCDLDEKEFLLAESDGSIFTAPHYDGHGAVLILLDEVDLETLASLLMDSYLLRAPTSIVRQFS